jgi:hypothetical protein
VGDVGDGFAARPTGGASDGELAMSPECREAFDLVDPSNVGDGGLQARFARTSDDAKLWHEISLVDEGFPSFTSLRDALGRCGTMSMGTGEERLEITFDPHLLDGPGEQAMAVVWHIRMAELPLPVSFEVYGVVSARAGVLSSLMAVGTFDEETLEGVPVDREHLWGLADLVDRRIQDVLAGRPAR